MNYVVTIPKIYCSFAVMDGPREGAVSLEGREGWNVEEGATIETVPHLYEWPDGAPAPRATLCRSRTNPRHYKVFNQPTDVPHEFEPTGNNFGGTYSRQGWERFVQGHLSELLKLSEVPDTDPPGAMDEAMRLIQGTR